MTSDVLATSNFQKHNEQKGHGLCYLQYNVIDIALTSFTTWRMEVNLQKLKQTNSLSG